MTELSRRKYLATAATLGLAGCTSRAGSDSTTSPETVSETTASTQTTDAEPTTEASTSAEVERVELPDEVAVGQPLDVTVHVSNPDRDPVRVVWNLAVIDVDAVERWTKSYWIEVEDGVADHEETLHVEWGTDHTTTLLVKPGSATISGLGNDAQTTDLKRVEVVDTAAETDSPKGTTEDTDT